jgi:hypothetical protein
VLRVAAIRRRRPFPALPPSLQPQPINPSPLTFVNACNQSRYRAKRAGAGDFLLFLGIRTKAAGAAVKINLERRTVFFYSRPSIV